MGKYQLNILKANSIPIILLCTMCLTLGLAVIKVSKLEKINLGDFIQQYSSWVVLAFASFIVSQLIISVVKVTACALLLISACPGGGRATLK